MKCDFPICDKESTINFKTIDGIEHHYCSVEHANDHRNVLMMELMRR